MQQYSLQKKKMVDFEAKEPKCSTTGLRIAAFWQTSCLFNSDFLPILQMHPPADWRTSCVSSFHFPTIAPTGVAARLTGSSLAIGGKGNNHQWFPETLDPVQLAGKVNLCFVDLLIFQISNIWYWNPRSLTKYWNLNPYKLGKPLDTRTFPSSCLQMEASPSCPSKYLWGNHYVICAPLRALLHTPTGHWHLEGSNKGRDGPGIFEL